ncbi:MAG: hypothetical protein UY48_C0038G0010 [Candidatus Gottesmanbacteria bacterium GW2011_GWB1_49_7]|uniref:Uncharacterized protein n=1 Tax=Candidatus Gottesmanbacteria bacterium GW2011_GWB1_49_7 TaxID=1618448 RepID=A0A0G1VVR2_9BACT|nr:MAG: hypothetical protein UY48_C0038G0010 [Candidatus Gottesmanbacteria bacterium GW2011_GWB1_49_7]
MSSLGQKLIQQIHARTLSSKPRTKREKEQRRTTEILSLVEKSATNTSNLAEDLVGPNKLGSVLLEALQRKAAIEVDPDSITDPGPGIRGRIKDRKKPDPGLVVSMKTIVIDGQEVECRVLSPGKKHFVGKSLPSGRAPGGTLRRDSADLELEQSARLLHYLERRQSATSAFHHREPNGKLKGGVHEDDFDAAVDALLTDSRQHGLDLEEFA